MRLDTVGVHGEVGCMSDSVRCGRKSCFVFGLLLPLAVVVVATVVLVAMRADLRAAGHFYRVEDGWYQGDAPILRALYQFGPWPALIVAISGLLRVIVSTWYRPWRKNWRVVLFFPLVMIMGPGILVNAIFKDHWGRPRPKQVVEFGGTQAYVPPWQPTSYHSGRSFPSGHASMGFYFMVPYFVYLAKRRRGVACVWMLVGLAGGAVMGYMRMAQGGHFLTDVLWSAAFVYLSGWCVARWLKLDEYLAPSPALASDVATLEKSTH